MPYRWTAKTARVFGAVAAYHALAREYGLDPIHMALAWLRTRPFPVIPIIGATTLEQLRTNIGAAGITLSSEVLEDIAETHRAHPAPY